MLHAEYIGKYCLTWWKLWNICLYKYLSICCGLALFSPLFLPPIFNQNFHLWILVQRWKKIKYLSCVIFLISSIPSMKQVCSNLHKQQKSSVKPYFMRLALVWKCWSKIFSYPDTWAKLPRRTESQKYPSWNVRWNI